MPLSRYLMALALAGIGLAGESAVPALPLPAPGRQSQAEGTMRLLLVEDSPRLIELLTATIRDAGWRLDAVSTLGHARAVAATGEHDLILVDLGLPDGDGLDLVREVRREGLTVPILVLTARAAVEERIAGLDAGADDYLVKPFHHDEFLARCRAMLRRGSPAARAPLAVGRLVYDPAALTLSCDGEEIHLSPRERETIELLIRQAGRVVPKRRLEAALSAYGEEMSANGVEVTISRLRRRLDAHPTEAAIETVRGVGYMIRKLAG